MQKLSPAHVAKETYTYSIQLQINIRIFKY